MSRQQISTIIRLAREAGWLQDVNESNEEALQQELDNMDFSILSMLRRELERQRSRRSSR